MVGQGWLQWMIDMSRNWTTVGAIDTSAALPWIRRMSTVSLDCNVVKGLVYKIGVQDDVLTMDDPDDYGDVFCYMSFKEAIDQELLTDYKIITIEVKKQEVAAFIKDNNLVKSNKKWENKNEARSLASMLALRKAMKRFPIRNAVSFHQIS